MAAEHPFIRRSKMWPKHTSDAVLEMHPDYANAIRQSLEHLTTPLTQVADDLKVNYRTLQSYATMQRGTPPAVGELLVKYLRHRIHNLTVLADFLDPLLKAEAERERDVREVQEKREREIEKRWGKIRP
jgi:hypothetical protein